MKRFVYIFSLFILYQFWHPNAARVEAIIAPPPYPPPYEIDISQAYPLASDRTVSSYVQPWILSAMIIAGVIAFLLIMGGGIMVISSAGNPQKQQSGKSAITAGIAGLVLVISAFWVVQLIAVLTGIDLLNIGV